MEAQKDCLVRAISKDGFVNAVAVYTRGLTERARQIHHTSPVATAALGRALAACSMMGNALKDNGASVTMQIKGDGPLGTILTVSDSEGNVRGYVQNPAVDLALREDGKLDVGTAVGHSGTLTVIKDLNMREPYVGTVDLLGGEIAEDVAAYYVESEQVDRADIRLAHIEVLDDRQRAAVTDGGADVQFAVLAQGEVDGGILHVAAHVALGVGNGQDRAERTVALDLHGDARAVILEGVAHHRAGGERAPERGRGDGGGVVDLAGALREAARVDRDGVDEAIFRDGADQTVLVCFHKMVPHFLIQLK